MFKKFNCPLNTIAADSREVRLTPFVLDEAGIELIDGPFGKTSNNLPITPYLQFTRDSLSLNRFQDGSVRTRIKRHFGEYIQKDPFVKFWQMINQG